MPVTRTLVNTGNPLIAPDGSLYSYKPVTFQLVKADTQRPISLSDVVNGEYVVGELITVTTDAEGLFSQALWPNTRGGVATYYMVSMPESTAKPFLIRVTEAEGSMLLIDAIAGVLPVPPQQTLTAFEALMASISSLVSQATELVTTTTNGLMSYVDKVRLDNIWVDWAAVTLLLSDTVVVRTSGGLAAAVAAAGSNRKTIKYIVDQTLTGDLSAPANVDLVPLNGSVIDHGSYAFAYAGNTANWPMAQVLSGSGDVTLPAEIYPCWFAGTDAQKAQKALDTAMNHPYLVGDPEQVEHNQVWFDRQYDITGSTLKLNKGNHVNTVDRRVLRMVGIGGGLTKTDAGYWFTKGDAVNTITGDVLAEKMNFIGLQGSGSVVWDAGTIIRLFSAYNTYKDVDTVSATRTTSEPGSYPSFAQSLRFDHDHVTGGVGKVHLWKSSGDCKITDCLVENRNADDTGGFLFNTPAEADTVNKVRNTSLVISNNVIENFNGDCMMLGATVASEIEGNYMEYVSGYYIDFATLQELNHYGVTVESNLFQATAAQVAADAAAIKWSKIAGGVVSSANFRNSMAPIHEIVPPPGGGYGILTTINDYGKVYKDGTDPAYISNLSGVTETTNTKSFGRLKQKTATLTEAYGGTLAAGSTTAFVFTFPSAVRAYEVVSVTSTLPDSLSIHVRTPTGTTSLTAYVQNRSASPVATYTLTATALCLTALGDN